MVRAAWLFLLLALSPVVITYGATAHLDRYAGQYRLNDEPEIVLSVFPAENHLTIEGTRMAATLLTPEGGNIFVTPDGETRYIFTLNQAGEAVGFTRKVHGSTPGITLEAATKISETPVHNQFRPYKREEVMIPMRDGVKLHAVILRPADQSGPLPFLLERSPYGSEWATSDAINERFNSMAPEGYIFVFEDLR